MTRQTAYSSRRHPMARHTRKEAGIQSLGLEAPIRPCSLDSGNPCRNDESVGANIDSEASI
ncbi:MAG: hypothetical protein ABL903_15440 [Methylococcales bacterium]